MVIPERERQDHTSGQRLADLLEATLLVEVVGVAEDALLLGAEVLRDRVDGVNTGNVDVGVLDDLAVLNVDATDLGESTGRGVVAGDELSHNCERLAGVDCQAAAQESGVTHAV